MLSFFQKSTSACIVLYIWSLLPSFACASPFLDPAAPAVHPDAQQVLGELRAVLGDKQRARAEERVVRLTLALMPTFQSLPQTAEGRLGPAAVRYLLHRYFVDRHGWFVRGLETGGQSWNSSSPTDVLGRGVGHGVRSIFERRLESHGLSLHEVAVFAATVKGLVHREMIDRLHAAYRLSNASSREESINESKAIAIIDTYMLMYVLHLDHAVVTPKEILKSS